MDRPCRRRPRPPGMWGDRHLRRRLRLKARREPVGEAPLAFGSFRGPPNGPIDGPTPTAPTPTAFVILSTASPMVVLLSVRCSEATACLLFCTEIRSSHSTNRSVCIGYKTGVRYSRTDEREGPADMPSGHSRLVGTGKRDRQDATEESAAQHSYRYAGTRRITGSNPIQPQKILETAPD